MLQVGIKGCQETIVTERDTAESMLSGMLPVYATPSLIAFMEYTAFSSVHSLLEPGLTTVGSRIDVKHISASPVGMNIKCISELIEIDGRRLVFKVEASDDFGPIGEGIHERFIIDIDRFINKLKKSVNESFNFI